jgi:hypothetical protein
VKEFVNGSSDWWFIEFGLGKLILGFHSVSSYQIWVRNFFSSFSNKEAWKGVFLDLRLFKFVFQHYIHGYIFNIFSTNLHLIYFQLNINLIHWNFNPIIEYCNKVLNKCIFWLIMHILLLFSLEVCNNFRVHMSELNVAMGCIS